MAIFNGLIDFVARILAFLYELPVVGGNYGLAIMMLTFVVMVLLMPLTLKATRSTIKMQQVQPQMKALQKEHKGDRETLNAEMMKLYSENGINPVGGCLPMLAQLPVFLVLFRILQGLTRRVEDRAFFGLANRLRVGRGETAVPGRNFDPQYLSVDSQLYQDLSTDTKMTFGPFDLAERAWDVLQSDFVGALPYIVLIAFVVGSSYFQQRQVSARRTDDGGEPSPMMQQQQMLLKFLPLMSGVWSFLFPAGLVLYWATSNLFRIGQQSYITHQIYGKEPKATTNEAQLDALSSGGSRRSKTDADEVVEAKAEVKQGQSKQGQSKQGQSKKNQSKKNQAKTDDSDSVDEPAASEEGSKKSTKKADREAQWQELRAAKAKKNKNTSGSNGSSRVTPKGTKSGPAKKKKR